MNQQTENRLWAIGVLLFMIAWIVFLIGLFMKSLWMCAPFMLCMIALGVCVIWGVIQSICDGHLSDF